MPKLCYAPRPIPNTRLNINCRRQFILFLVFVLVLGLGMGPNLGLFLGQAIDKAGGLIYV